MTRLLVATTNPGKLREIRLILAGLPVELLSLEAYPDVPPADETGRTFAENARAKALYYAAATDLVAVAEDSGLEIDALGGAPGVHSARYGLPDATNYPQKFELIYRQLRERDAASSTARFVCALAMASGGSVVFEARGAVEGVIISTPRGEGGFGYDPILYYPPLGRTLAELSEEEKAVISHRGQAFRALAEHLRGGELATQG
jgi:XTP/dITP diphosphohydrolase